MKLNYDGWGEACEAAWQAVKNCCCGDEVKDTKKKIQKGQRDKKTKRQKDTKTKRQREKATEREKDIKTQKQKKANM